MRLGRDRQPPRPLRGEVLPGRDRVPGVRHRDGVPLPVGAHATASCPARARSTPASAAPASPSSGWARSWSSWASSWSRSPTSGASAPSGGSSKHMGFLDFATTKVEAAANWARKFSLFQYPFVTACCGMEFMSVAAPKYDIARFGAEFPRFSPRQADLLMIVGTITERQGPALRRIYEQMCEPKWVVAFGVCASTGGFYQNYSTMPGADQVDPGRRLHPGLPAAARAGARRPDPAAGAHPARRRPQPGRDRQREGREEGRQAGHRLRRPGACRSGRASKRAKARRPHGADRPRSSDGAVHGRRDPRRPARSTATNGRACGATPGSTVATFLRDDPTTKMEMFIDLTARRSLQHASRASTSSCTSTRSASSTASACTAACPRTTRRIDTLVPRLGGRELVRARGLRPVRRALQGPPRPAPHPDVPGVRRAPAAQGLPEREAPAAGAPRRTPRRD